MNFNEGSNLFRPYSDIRRREVKPNPDKIVVIKKYPIAEPTKQIKSFLGLTGYYRKFKKDFARLTKSLTTCLKTNSKIPQFVKYFRTVKIY